MAQTMINFCMDETLKEGMEQEKRIPFEITPDPFYSDKNMARLRAAVADARAGRNMVEHELVTVEDD